MDETLNAAPRSSARWAARLGITGLYVALTAVMTWPQLPRLATHTAEDPDVFFNLWRLRWIHRALTTAPDRLFDGNLFYPEPGVLAMSDALLLQGVLALPLFLAGLPPVLVHNLLLLGAIVASGAGMFVFARHVSGSRTAAILAGIVFAFAPYRFEHYMHMELQWAVWIPWTFWALQRTFETGTLRFGVLTGIFIALQMLSAIYYGIFLGMFVAVIGCVQLLRVPRTRFVSTLRSLAAGAAIAAAVSAAYSIPYQSVAPRVGTRFVHEVTMFSAQPADYLAATPSNLLYGGREGKQERRLFPGFLPLLLALFGALALRRSVAMVSYLVGLALAFELSLGMHGLLYPVLYEHVSALRGLRAPARASIFGLAFLGVLAAAGCTALGRRLRPAARGAAAVSLSALVLLEYWVAPLHLMRVDNTAPPLYAWLARQPRGVVAEFPMALHPGVSDYESRYAYMSTFHWMPLLNGYSGYRPPSYLRRLKQLTAFPDDVSLEQLRADGVRYLIIHSGGYEPEERRRIVERLIADYGLAYLGDWNDGWGDGVVFALR